MHNLKFCNKLISLLTLTYKQNNLWFDIILTKNIFSLLTLFQSTGLISYFYIFINNSNKFFRVFLRYSNLEIPVLFPIFFYFKPSHKISVNLKSLKKFNNNLGSSILILSTNRGLLLHSDCLKFGIGGLLYLIIYI